MKTKYLISLVIISFATVGFINPASKVFAQEADASDIQYPVEELGGCQDQADCKSYCDRQENIEACLDFAEKNNLMSPEEIQIAKNFIATEDGPGGCTSKDACEQYCNDISHIDECISFAIENNLMPLAELEEAKKVQAAIAQGIKPPSCGNKKACDAYCEEPDHMEECIAFGAAAGFIQGKELEDAQKMLQALKRGVKAPPCKGKDACDEYCSQPDNMEVCMNFAIEAGFMNEQEKADAQKMLQAIKKGVKPPNCKNKEECDVYCNQDEHFEECMNFAEAAGFMSVEDAKMARKTGGKGPGGCKGKQECEAFCNNPDNQQTCFDFGKENGLIPEEDLRQMEEGTQRFKESLEQAPAAVMDCLNSQIGSDKIEKLKNGTMMPSNDIGEKMRGCFETMGPPPGEGGPGAGGMMPPAGEGQAGPEGCSSPDECQNYCVSHPQECQNFQQPMVPGTPLPGGEGSPPSAINQNCAGPNCQQVPNQMANPEMCQGENCQYGSPPAGQQLPGQQFPGYQPSPIQQQPPAGENIPLMPQPPVDQQPLVPPPGSSLNLNLLLGSVIQYLLKLITH